MAMRRVSAIGITGHWGALMVALMVAGCGSFNPPPPPELATLPDARSADSRTLIEVLPSSTPNPERDRWLQAIRVEAGMSRITLLETPEPSGAAPAWRADRIRTAETRGVKVLIVEADDVAAVATALEDAHHKGSARPYHRRIDRSADVAVRHAGALRRD